jgi:hypothetical protein
MEKKTVSRPHPPGILRLSCDKKINSNGYDDVAKKRMFVYSEMTSFFLLL